MIIKLSSNISRTIAAPNGWSFGQPLFSYYPPAPLQEEMSQGKLTDLNKRTQNMLLTGANNDVSRMNQSSFSLTAEPPSEKAAEEASSALAGAPSTASVVDSSSTSAVVAEESNKKIKTRHINLDFGFEDSSDEED